MYLCVQPVQAGIALAILLVPWFALAIRNRLRRLPFRVGAIRSLRDAAVPMVTLLLGLYAVSVLWTCIEERRAQAALKAAATNEFACGRRSSSSGWPDSLPLDPHYSANLPPLVR